VAVTWQRLVGVHQALTEENASTPAVALCRQVDFDENASTASFEATFRTGDGCSNVTLREYRADELPDAGLAAVDYWAVDFQRQSQVGGGRLRPQPGTTLVENVRPQPTLEFKDTVSNLAEPDWQSDIDPCTFTHDLFACRYGARQRDLSLTLSAKVDAGGPPRVKVIDCFGREAIVEATPEQVSPSVGKGTRGL
jgi:hypothetical protein